MVEKEFENYRFQDNDDGTRNDEYNTVVKTSMSYACIILHLSKNILPEIVQTICGDRETFSKRLVDIHLYRKPSKKLIDAVPKNINDGDFMKNGMILLYIYKNQVLI